ncbi:MAG: thioredoxin family protein [bacterium]|nr:thioredoxin family protein [bacterium]
MPRPPILPTIDWRAVFEGGDDFASWLKRGESPENQSRMETIRADLAIEPQWQAFLTALPRQVRVVAIAEDWCGDVVRHAPAMQKLADGAPNLEVRYVYREDHPDVFARFLTNGGEAIPKFVFLSQDFVECGSWGPMPSQCRELIARGKACGDVGAARKKVSGLYEADSDQRYVLRELLQLVDIAASTAP